MGICMLFGACDGISLGSSTDKGSSISQSQFSETSDDSSSGASFEGAGDVGEGTPSEDTGNVGGEAPPEETPTPAEFSTLVDFTVDVPEDRSIRVLQITDTQIIDAAQTRPGRTGVYYDQWAPENMGKGCFQYVTQAVEQYDPDLILMTGDLVYGEFDDAGTSLLSLIAFMDSLKTPWAPVFGNHDNESTKGADWQCEQLKKAEYCLFKQRTLTGNGNYSVGVLQKGKPIRVFYMLDSNGCSMASAESLSNGHTVTTLGLALDQIAWYEDSLKAIKKDYPSVTYSIAFHIQPQIFSSAYISYGYTGSSSDLPIDIDKAINKKATDFGYIGRVLKGAWDSSALWSSVKACGIDSIFVGHEHCNNASVVYQGVRLAYGLKTGQYDRANYQKTDGSIVGSYDWSVGTPIVGATAIEISSDGRIVNSYHIYCDDEMTEEPPQSSEEAFDTADQTTWFETAATKESVEDGARVTFSAQGQNSAQIGVTLRAEAISYLRALGYNKIQFVITSDTRIIEIYEDRLSWENVNKETIETGSGSYTVAITETNMTNGKQMLFMPYMRSATTVTGTVTVQVVGLA